MGTFDPFRHDRRSIRLRGYDYSRPGAYFATICTQDREQLLGAITKGRMTLSSHGEIVQWCWEDLPGHYETVALDAFVVMPNHVHGIVLLHDNAPDDVGAGLKPAPTGNARRRTYSLSEIIRGFKTFSARRINESRGTPGASVWQRNYYEHIVRNDAELDRIREYIANNPVAWESDEYYAV